MTYIIFNRFQRLKISNKLYPYNLYTLKTDELKSLYKSLKPKFDIEYRNLDNVSSYLGLSLIQTLELQNKIRMFSYYKLDNDKLSHYSRFSTNVEYKGNNVNVKYKYSLFYKLV